jgi:hypothetical protein
MNLEMREKSKRIFNWKKYNKKRIYERRNEYCKRKYPELVNNANTVFIN